MSAFIELLSQLIQYLLEKSTYQPTNDLIKKFSPVIPTQFKGDNYQIEIYFKLLVENYKKFKCGKMEEQSQDYKNALESCYALAQTDHIWTTIKSTPQVAEVVPWPTKIRKSEITKSKLA